jgi:Lactate dehydrogenase and related dehydrogenases
MLQYSSFSRKAGSFMKVLMFHVNKDEEEYIRECNRNFCFDLQLAGFDFNTAEIDSFKGFDAVWILTGCKITADKAEMLAAAGVRYIVSRAAGIDHMDLAALQKAGIKASNVSRYSPNAIAEHTVCVTLMALRKMKRELKMIDQYDFTLNGLKGRELRNLTVGVIGTGRIGAETVKILSGFGCRILAYDLYENQEIKKHVTYSTMQEIFTDSDIIILHCPLTKENEKMINSNTIERMKEGSVLINTARGGLVDYEALLGALENGKISAAAFDVYEDEFTYIRKKTAPEQFANRTLKKLMEKDNVIYTAHMSFFTDTAIRNMILTSFENLKEYSERGHCTNDVTE